MFVHSKYKNRPVAFAINQVRKFKRNVIITVCSLDVQGLPYKILISSRVSE
jgi:hypothetical protein